MKTSIFCKTSFLRNLQNKTRKMFTYLKNLSENVGLTIKVSMIGREPKGAEFQKKGLLKICCF